MAAGLGGRSAAGARSGHSSMKITEKHYAPWVQARQTQLEADLARAWRNDPLAQKETLRAESVRGDGPRTDHRPLALAPALQSGTAVH